MCNSTSRATAACNRRERLSSRIPWAQLSVCWSILLFTSLVTSPTRSVAKEYVFVAIEGDATPALNPGLGCPTAYSVASFGGITAASGTLTGNPSTVSFGGSGMIPVNEDVLFSFSGRAIEPGTIDIVYPECYVLQQYIN